MDGMGKTPVTCGDTPLLQGGFRNRTAGDHGFLNAGDYGFAGIFRSPTLIGNMCFSAALRDSSAVGTLTMISLR